MNENEKLANSVDESSEALTESEMQSTNDSQQNIINSEKAESPAEAPKKPATRRNMASNGEKTEKSPALDSNEKPKRKPTKKKAEAPAEITEQARAELAEEASVKTAEDVRAEASHEVVEELPIPAEDTEAASSPESDVAKDIPVQEAPAKTANKPYSEPTLVISTDQFSWSLEATDDDVEPEHVKFVGERIIPPDELFASRSYPDEELTELADTEVEEAAELSDEPSEEYSDDENLDDDGQYTLGELELQNEASEKAFTDEVMEKYDPKKPRKIDGRFDLVELFVFTLLAVMIVTTFFFRHAVVDGASMENTLHGGEHLIISDFFYTPKRGDIIVCEDYTTDVPKPIVKRVIAVEGDRIVVNKNGEVFINDELLKEDYVFIDGVGMKYEIDEVVAEGEIFVMGDHRNVSLDSRKIGSISVDSVLGKVLLRFYPFNKFGTVN